MAGNVGLAAERIRPGGPGLQAASPGAPGAVAKIAFTGTAGTTQIRPTPTANTYGLKQQPQYISVKTTGAVHLCFGDSAVGNATDAEFLLEPSDSWQDLMLLPGDTHVSVKGDAATTGNLYVAFTGR